MQYGSCLENQSLSFRFFPSTSVTESIPLYILSGSRRPSLVVLS